MLFHFVVAAGLIQNQAGSRVFNQYPVNDHFNPVVLRLWVACTTGLVFGLANVRIEGYACTVLMSPCKEIVGINLQRPEI